MTTRTAQISPQVYARIGGTLYLLIIIAGALGEIFIRGKLIVSGDAISTANNIMASQSLWRIGIAGLSYLMNSFTLILAPEYAGMIFPVLILALIGELSLCLWLIVKGVDLPKWENRAFESA